MLGRPCGDVDLCRARSMPAGSGPAGLRHPEHGRSSRRQHERQGRALLHRHDGPRFQDHAADPRPVEPELSARDRASRRHAAAIRRRGEFHHRPDPCAAPETVAKDGVPRGTITSFTLSSKDSVIYNPGLIRDDTPGCNNSSIMVTTTAPGDKSNMIVTTSHPGTWTPHDRGLCPAELCARRGSAVHRARRRRFDRLEGHEHDPGQSDPAAPRAADGLHPDRQWRPGRARRPARARIRHGVGDLCAVRRARSVAAASSSTPA